MKIKKLNTKYTGTFATRIVIALTIVIGVALVIIVSHLVDKSKDCELPKISPSEVGKIDNQTFFVIGHAYGRSGLGGFISPNIIPFLDKHFRTQTAKASLILTGDLLSRPTKEKLQKVKKILLNRFANFYIAPGNHDIFNHNTRDLFFEQFPNTYPYIQNTDNLSLLFLDSSTSPWRININDLPATLAKATSKNVIVFSHNPLHHALTKFTNSQSLLPEDLNLKKQARAIAKKLKGFNAISIAGDGGYRSEIPSTVCKDRAGIRYILNGIGNYEKDEILLIQKGNIYRMALK